MLLVVLAFAQLAAVHASAPRPDTNAGGTHAAAFAAAPGGLAGGLVAGDKSAWKGRMPICGETHMDQMLKDFPDNTPEYAVSPFIEVANVTEYHFPKKTVPQKKIFAPKWQQDRDRGWKKGPKTQMRHMLSPPTKPRGVFVIFDVPTTQDWGENATLFWDEPESFGASPITSYEMSWDKGVTWMKAGGADTRHVVVGGLERLATYPILVRAWNKVGFGPFASFEVQNARRPTYHQQIFYAAPVLPNAPYPTPYIVAAEQKLAGDLEAVPVLRSGPKSTIHG